MIVGRQDVCSMSQQHLDNIHVTTNTGKHQWSMLLQRHNTVFQSFSLNRERVTAVAESQWTVLHVLLGLSLTSTTKCCTLTKEKLHIQA